MVFYSSNCTLAFAMSTSAENPHISLNSFSFPTSVAVATQLNARVLVLRVRLHTRATCGRSVANRRQRRWNNREKTERAHGALATVSLVKMFCFGLWMRGRKSGNNTPGGMVFVAIRVARQCARGSCTDRLPPPWPHEYSAICGGFCAVSARVCVCALHTTTKVTAAPGRTGRSVVARSLHVAAHPHLATLYVSHESARTLSALRQYHASARLIVALTASTTPSMRLCAQ